MRAAMILCAGFGTRLNELTKTTPKPMLLINGKPLLEYTITHLASLGIKNIVINLHYLADQITDYFGDGTRFGVNIEYSYEDAPLGTAGAIKNVESTLYKYDDFLVLYGDIICSENYDKLFDVHSQNKSAIGTIILHERNRSNSVVEMDLSNKITRFVERPKAEVLDKKQDWVNSGLYCFKRDILNYIPKGEFCDFPKDVFSKLVDEGSLYGFPLTSYRCAIDSPERYLKAKEDFSANSIFA